MERLSDEQLVELCGRARGGDVEARNRVVEAFVPFVKHIAVKAARARWQAATDPAIIDDMVQEGCVAIVRAAAYWLPNQGSKFSTYAGRAAIRSMQLWLKGHIQRTVKFKQVDGVLEMFSASGDGALEALADQDERAVVAAAFNSLNDYERELLIRWHGLGKYPPQDPAAIAWRFGVDSGVLAQQVRDLGQRLRAAVA